MKDKGGQVVGYRPEVYFAYELHGEKHKQRAFDLHGYDRNPPAYGDHQAVSRILEPFVPGPRDCWYDPAPSYVVVLGARL